jgi:dTDP-4-dehydrorhamnose 3,5-epimerase
LEINGLGLEGVFEIKAKKIGDSRGYFAETYLSNVFEKCGLQTEWVQENQSYSSKINTIRGLHFQAPPFAQAKLVQVPLGAILDIFVDIRRSSPTYGEWGSITVSDELCNAVYVPQGFAHGFCTLTENVLVQYKVDNVYSAEHEGGICWDDEDIAIEWNIEKPNLSVKDIALGKFRDFTSPFE